MARIEGGNRAELARLLRSADRVNLVTQGADGHFHARPMLLEHGKSGVEGLWFVTRADSRKVQDLTRDPHCAVTMEGAGGAYASFSGRALVLHDDDLVRELWNPLWAEWFPEGPAASGLRVISFEPEHIEYLPRAKGRLEVVVSVVHERVPSHATRVQPEMDLPP